MGVKIGCRFAYTQVRNLQIDFHLVTGLIIIPRIPEHLITLNLLHGLLGFISVCSKIRFNSIQLILSSIKVFECLFRSY